MAVSDPSPGIGGSSANRTCTATTVVKRLLPLGFHPTQLHGFVFCCYQDSLKARYLLRKNILLRSKTWRFRACCSHLHHSDKGPPGAVSQHSRWCHGGTVQQRAKLAGTGWAWASLALHIVICSSCSLSSHLCKEKALSGPIILKQLLVRISSPSE